VGVGAFTSEVKRSVASHEDVKAPGFAGRSPDRVRLQQFYLQYAALLDNVGGLAAMRFGGRPDGGAKFE
jgi:hypothetical protein